MKVQRIYIDTSVIGGCFDDEFAPVTTSRGVVITEALAEPLFAEVGLYLADVMGE